MTELKWGAHFPAEAMDAINSLLAEKEEIRRLLEGMRTNYWDLAELYEKLKGENEQLRVDAKVANAEYALLLAGYRELRDENERLRENLQWLRDVFADVTR